MTTRSTHKAQHVSQTTRNTSNKNLIRSARFWDRIAKRYAAQPVANAEAYAQKLAITRNYLHANSEVLELGCGTGSTALVHAPYVKHIRATDFSSKMIEIAIAKASAAEQSNVEFACSTVLNECVCDKKYDAILALSLLHLIKDWQGTIEATYRMLKPGGVLVTSTMCMNDSHAWLRFIAPAGIIFRLIPQLSFFTKTEFNQAMFSVGFEIEHSWQPTSKTGLFVVARKAL